MKIRITAPVVEFGCVQFLRNQETDLPEELAVALVEKHEAELIPFAETATRPRPENAAIQRTPRKPTPPPNPKGR